MRISAELRDHEAAGSLAEELPYWGWLEDGRTCLTRTGELIAAGRLEPAVVDGRSPEQIDRVLGRWQRLLSGLDADTRLYFYMLRRPSVPEATDDEGSGIVAVSQRKRGAFLSGRVQRLEAYLVWSHDPRLRTVADGPNVGKRLPAHAVVEAPPRGRAHLPRFRDRGRRRPLSRDGGRGPCARGGAHADRDARARRSLATSLRADQPSGHGVGRRDGERHELAARAFGARGGAQSPAARRRARDPVLAPVSARPSLREPAPGALLPGRGDDGLARVAALGDGSGEAPDPRRAAALLRAPLLDDGARAGDRGHGGRDGRLGRGHGVGPARARRWSSWKRTG